MRHEGFGTTKQKSEGTVWLRGLTGHEVTELGGKSNPNFTNTKIIVRKDSWKKSSGKIPVAKASLQTA